jgi:uncharacterized membrane protein
MSELLPPALLPELLSPRVLLWLCLLLPAVWVMAWYFGARKQSLYGRRRHLLTALRCVALITVIVALAGPVSQRTSTGHGVVFVLDRSASVSDDSFGRGVEFIKNAVATKPPRTQIGVVVFGATPAVEHALSNSPLITENVQSFVDQGATDLGAAIELAVANLPAAGQRTVVVISDGAQTSGDARAAAGAAQSLGIDVFSVALDADTAHNEIRLQGISAPDWVHANEPFELHASIESTTPAAASVVILRDGVAIHQTEVTLKAGNNRISVADQLPARGLREYEVLINSDADTRFENNRFSTFVEVRGPPRVLHVYGTNDEQQPLTQALQVQNIDVDAIQAAQFPAQHRQLDNYDLVILNNVSGFDLTLAKMELLERFVRDSGAGVISIGGTDAYGAGGYYATPIEALLPVDMDIKTDASIPLAAVNILIDKSGSMSTEVQGEQKLAIAKRAALAAIEVLNPLDQIGVLAFDSAFEWTVSPMLAGEQRAIADGLAGMTVGGDTDLFAALTEAHRMAKSQQAKVKHLIVLSDGLTSRDADFAALSRRIAADDITISTVAFGANADQTLMRGIATLGNGRYYFASDLQNIPRIFTSETLTLTRDLFVEQTVNPAINDQHELLAGFDTPDLPVLRGYQRTYPKPAAQTLLMASDDPLLVTWRYGLGRSVAFMSDFSGRWGSNWIQWPEFSRFAAQTARWAMRRRGDDNLTATFSVQDQTATVTIDALDRDDQFINQLKLSATISNSTASSGSALSTDLQQTGPGRYRGEFAITPGDQYFVTLSPSHTDIAPKLFGFVAPYSSEYLGLGLNLSLLEDLGRGSGHGVMPLSRASLDTILTPSADATSAHRIWWPWLLIALIALIAEVALRKITAKRVRHT